MSLKFALRFLPYLPATLFFNFKYLPFRQAVKLPIWLYKPHLNKCRGTVRIESDHISTGMILLGVHRCRVYPNNGFSWTNLGGTCVFKGKCIIGNDSYVMISRRAKVEFGDHFKVNAGMKLASRKRIAFGKNVLLGWGVTFLDSSFHKMKKADGSPVDNSDKEIVIGSNNWISTGTMVSKGARTPDYCTVAAHSLLRKDYSGLPSYILLAGEPLSVKKEGIWHDAGDDELEG